MGRYFNPATVDAIKTAGGRALAGQDHDTLVKQLAEGEALGMFNDRLMFKQVADVTDPREFEEFESQYQRGILVSRSFYALPKSEFH